VPITFCNSHSQGKSRKYFDGFPADFTVGDSPQFNWGEISGTLRFGASNSIHPKWDNKCKNEENSYLRPKWEMIEHSKGFASRIPSLLRHKIRTLQVGFFLDMN